MKKIIFVILSGVLIFSSGLFVFAEESETLTREFYTGVAEMTDEELEAFHSTLPRIVDVKPNSIALSRLSEDESVLLENIEVAELGKEMVYAMPGDETSLMSTSTEFALTSAVDVSEALTFPPIGDQKQTSSCMLWSLCYYQLTNNNCVVNDMQAKTINKEGEFEEVAENVMAPGFIYSLVNGGENRSENYEAVCNAIMTHGCPNINDYDLEITEESLKKWCTDTEVWYNAIYNKPKKISYRVIDKTDLSSKSIEENTIKEILSNGYVVTMSTYVNSFEYTSNTSTGEYGCRYMKNDKNGGHAMTIAGYDDNFWIDVNGNNKSDVGEKGAFKIINSWGKIDVEGNPYSNGYVWMSYDALFNESEVIDAPLDREGAINAYYYIETQKNYTPLLVAEVEIAAVQRNYIGISLGISEVGSYEPINFYSVSENGRNAAFNSEINYHDCLDVNFSGEYESETATFAFDLTHIVKKTYGKCGINSNKKMLLSAIVNDENPYDEKTIEFKTLSLLDPITGKKVTCSDTTSIVADEMGAYKSVGFEMESFVGYNQQQMIELVFNSNIQAESIAENIYIVNPDGEIIYPIYDIESNKIVISPPLNGYECDTKYELHVKSNIRSLGGNTLGNQYVIPLYILGEHYVFLIDLY